MNRDEIDDDDLILLPGELKTEDAQKKTNRRIRKRKRRDTNGRAKI